MKFFTLLIACLLCTTLNAQDEQEQEYRNGIIPVTAYCPEISLGDSLRLPEVDFSGRVMHHPAWLSPWAGTLWGWDLHEGLNVSIGASATVASSGGHTTSGLGQNVAVMYARAVNKRFSYAIGGYINNYTFGHGQYREGGISAMLNYQFNDRLEGYAYIQKSISHEDNGRMPFYRMYGYPGMYGRGATDFMNAGDRIGGGLRWQTGKHSYLQLNVEYSRLPATAFAPWQHPGYHPYYGYPGMYSPYWW